MMSGAVSRRVIAGDPTIWDHPPGGRRPGLLPEADGHRDPPTGRPLPEPGDDAGRRLEDQDRAGRITQLRTAERQGRQRVAEIIRLDAAAAVRQHYRPPAAPVDADPPPPPAPPDPGPGWPMRWTR